jgi:hypothetical protein
VERGAPTFYFKHSLFTHTLRYTADTGTRTYVVKTADTGTRTYVVKTADTGTRTYVVKTADAGTRTYVVKQRILVLVRT